MATRPIRVSFQDVPANELIRFELSGHLPDCEIHLDDIGSKLGMVGEPQAPVSLSSLSFNRTSVTFMLAGDAAAVDLNLRVVGSMDFVFGRLIVPSTTRIVIWSAAQFINLFGATFWALPLSDPLVIWPSGEVLVPPVHNRQPLDTPGAMKPAERPPLEPG
jgi:hypothetical protein